MLSTENIKLYNIEITYVTLQHHLTAKSHEIFHIHSHPAYVWTEVVSVTLQTKSVPGRFWKRQYIIEFHNHTFITKNIKIKKCKKTRQSVINCIGTQKSCSMDSELRNKIAQSPLCSYMRSLKNESHRTPSANCHSQETCKRGCVWSHRAA